MQRGKELEEELEVEVGEDFEEDFEYELEEELEELPELFECRPTCCGVSQALWSHFPFWRGLELSTSTGSKHADTHAQQKK